VPPGMMRIDVDALIRTPDCVPPRAAAFFHTSARPEHSSPERFSVHTASWRPTAPRPDGS
jgi:hypothetical protein